MTSLLGLWGCCTCTGPTAPEPEPEEGASASIKEAFRSYQSKTRTELAEDVIEPSLNLNGWTIREGQKFVMLEIEKEKEKNLGLAIEASKDGLGLTVSEVEAEGLVAEWNQDRPLRAINVGDVIVEVNKIRGSFKELFKQIQKHQHLQLLVQCS